MLLHWQLLLSAVSEAGQNDAEHMSGPYVLRSYRELLRLVARLPTEPERQAALSQAQQGMRKHQSACEEEVADLHRKLVSKVQFLRMKVPRLRRDDGKVGAAKFVVRDGKVVEGMGRTAGARCAVLIQACVCASRTAAQCESIMHAFAQTALPPEAMYHPDIEADTCCRAADGKGVGKQEAWEMHRKLMKRQYFGQEPPVFSEMM